MVFYAFGLLQHFVPSGSLGETWNYLKTHRDTTCTEPRWAAVDAALELDMTLCKFPQVQLRLNVKKQKKNKTKPKLKPRCHGYFSVLINLKPKKCMFDVLKSL